jgi:hypothetical protein
LRRIEMRYLITIMVVLALAINTYSAEISFGVDGCSVLNNSIDSLTPSKIAVHFAFPDTLVGKEIVYAELSGSLSLHHAGPDSLFELRFYPLLAESPVGRDDYVSIEAITDSMSTGVYTARLGDSCAFYIDLTGFLMELSARERTNYGLVATADLLGDGNLMLPEAIGERLRNIMRIRVIYK